MGKVSRGYVNCFHRGEDSRWCVVLPSVPAHTLPRPSNSLCSGSKGNAPVFYSHQANSDPVNISGYYWSRPSRRKPSQQGRGSQPFHNNVYVVNTTRVPLQICFLDVTDWGQTSEATILLDYTIKTTSRLTSYTVYFHTYIIA